MGSDKRLIWTTAEYQRFLAYGKFGPGGNMVYKPEELSRCLNCLRVLEMSRCPVCEANARADKIKRRYLALLSDVEALKGRIEDIIRQQPDF